MKRILSLLLLALIQTFVFAGMPAEVRAALPMNAASGASAVDYRLKPMDVVEVRVFQEPELTGRRLVDQDGSVSLSMVGPIKVAGLSTSQAADKIRSVLKDGWLTNPKVEVNISAFAKKSVSVMGEVARPGAVDIRPGQSLDLVQALAAAGGVTPRGNARSVVIKRGAKVFEIDAYKLATDPSAGVFTLNPDDIVTVKTRIF